VALHRRLRAYAHDGALAGLVAAVPSGLPSTAVALVRGEDPLEAAAAAGSLILSPDAPVERLVLAAVPVHLTLSIAWGAVLGVLLPRRRPIAEGAAAGAAIAALDLGVIGRRHRRISALPKPPQVADHLAYGACVGAALSRGDAARGGFRTASGGRAPRTGATPARRLCSLLSPHGGGMRVTHLNSAPAAAPATPEASAAPRTSSSASARRAITRSTLFDFVVAMST
jgi:hypothetical protein